MKNKPLACLLLAVLCLLAGALVSQAAELREIEGWQNGGLRTTRLDTVSGNRSVWQERDYITASGARVHAVWMEGAGEKGWTPPSVDAAASDGLMGSGASYRTLIIASERAVIEKHPVTGYCVAVKIEKRGTLTVESKYAEEDEILSAAKVLTEMMQ